MPTNSDLSSLPPATLRAALVASEKREEKEKLRWAIGELQKRLDELEEARDVSEVEPVRNVASGSQHKAIQLRVGSPSNDEVAEEMRNRRWPIARGVLDPVPVSPQSPSCTRCRTKGVRCEWDENSNIRRCLACSRSKAGCDMKRPIRDGETRF